MGRDIITGWGGPAIGMGSRAPEEKATFASQTSEKERRVREHGMFERRRGFMR
jgi:hypothetical protein